MTTTFDRRRLLKTGIGAAAGILLLPPATVQAARAPRRGPAPSLTPYVPGPAARAGMTRRVLHTTFNDLSSIDMDHTGRAGFTWYTNYSWDWSKMQDPRRSLSIRRDRDGTRYLWINPDKDNCNWSISTVDQATQVGRHLTYGYIECWARFVTPPPITDWSRVAWPSIWLASMRNQLGEISWANGEIDILEAMNGDGQWTGGLHEWPGYQPGTDQRDRTHYAIGFSRQYWPGASQSWHKYACLWERPDAAGLGKVTFFIDDQYVVSQQYGPRFVVREREGGITSATPNATNTWARVPALPAGTLDGLNRDKMTLVIGTGVGRPMAVRSVSIYGY